jgi:hypothetical protein
MSLSETNSLPSKKIKPSQDCTCDLCDKVMSRRGLFNHLRLKHQLSNDEARETTRRILQNTPYAYTGVTRLLTISINENRVVKVKTGIKNESELFYTLRAIAKALNILIIIPDDDISERYHKEDNLYKENNMLSTIQSLSLKKPS